MVMGPAHGLSLRSPELCRLHEFVVYPGPIKVVVGGLRAIKMVLIRKIVLKNDWKASCQNLHDQNVFQL